MSIHYLNYAFDAAIKSPVQKLIMIALADHANDEGWSFPSVSTIIKKTSLSEATIRENLKKMEESGLIRIERATMEQGRSTASYYQIITADTSPDSIPPPRRGVLDLFRSRPPAAGPSPSSSHTPTLQRLDPLNHHLNATSEEDESSSPPRVVNPPRKVNAITPNRLKTLWNTLVPSLSPVREITAKHLSSAKARGNEESLAEIFAIVEASEFLSGRGERTSHKDWNCSIDWVLKPDNYANIANGKYTNKPKTTSSNGRSDSANLPGRYT